MTHRIGFAQASYPVEEVHAQMGACLPRASLALFSEDGRVRWRPRLLVMTALMAVWQTASTAGERFSLARGVLTRMFVGRRRAGYTYNGFMAALERQSSSLFDTLLPWWRGRALAWSGEHGRLFGWTLFGVDGTKINCPRSVANEKSFGCAGKAGSAPQQLLTVLLHLGSWMPWSWRRGPGTDDERAHLLSMLGDLPADALLLADALYTSYALLCRLIDTKVAFVVRAGANVNVLRDLGYHVVEEEHIVYLWPNKQQRHRQPPLALRLIRVQDGRSRRMCLMTNVLEPDRLSDAQAVQLYARRWGVEVTNRTLKQTLDRHTVQSMNISHAQVELDWNVAALAVLALINLRMANRNGTDPLQRSPSDAVRLLRQWMFATHKLVQLAILHQQLAKTVLDNYSRAGPKSNRPWPRKKQTKPPGTPSARKATDAQIQLAKQLRQQDPRN